jgi:hypothetical protein
MHHRGFPHQGSAMSKIRLDRADGKLRLDDGDSQLLALRRIAVG